MAFSSRLKRKNEAISAAHDRAIYEPEVEKLLQICQLHSDLDTLSDALMSMSSVEPVWRAESDAILAEMREIKKLISELRNG
jgi:hypothetical protein